MCVLLPNLVFSLLLFFIFTIELVFSRFQHFFAIVSSYSSCFLHLQNQKCAFVMTLFDSCDHLCHRLLKIPLIFSERRSAVLFVKSLNNMIYVVLMYSIMKAKFRLKVVTRMKRKRADENERLSSVWRRQIPNRQGVPPKKGPHVTRRWLSCLQSCNVTGNWWRTDWVCDQHLTSCDWDWWGGEASLEPNPSVHDFTLLFSSSSFLFTFIFPSSIFSDTVGLRLRWTLRPFVFSLLLVPICCDLVSFLQWCRSLSQSRTFWSQIGHVRSRPACRRPSNQ